MAYRLLTFTLIGLLTGLLSGCTSMLFYPMKGQLLTPDVVGVFYDDVMLETSDGLRLHGWILHAEGEPHGTILYFHGNAENISTHFGNVFWLTRAGYEIMLFDYRGYGQSEGEPELDGLISDAQQLIGHAVANHRTDTLVVLGQSLGAGIAVYATANSVHRPSIDALVTVSGFSDYHDIAQDVLARSWVTWLFQVPLSYTINNRYSPLDAVGRLTPVPVLVMHSREDRIIGFHHAQALFDAANEPKQLIEITGGHNTPFNNEANRRLLLQYLEAVGR